MEHVKRKFGMKGKLIITVGISGSGKSTWAHQKWLSDPNKYVIVNRDKIRELMFGYTEQSVDQYYRMDKIGGFEKQVTRYEDTLINEGLNFGKTVIVDATNLTRKYLERFKYWNVPSEIVVFEIELDKALNRDLTRNRTVGEDVIRRQYSRFITLINDLAKNPIDFTPVEFRQDKDKDPCFIFDIDGTLAHMNRGEGGRSPYDWDRVGEDTVDFAVDMVCDIINKTDVKTIICTGRDGAALEETKIWMGENHVLWDEIFIRNKGDMRADWIVKEEMWREIAEDYYIVGMFDDRLQVVRRARALGLKVFNVEYHNF